MAKCTLRSVLSSINRIVLSSKKKTTDEYGVAARMVTRVINMNWEPFAVINAGVSLLALDSDEAIELAMADASEK